MRRWGPVLMLVSLFLVACGGDQTAAPVIDATTGPASLTVQVRGAATLDFSGRAPVQQVASASEKVPENLRFYSVAVPDFTPAGKARFRGGFNLYGYNPGITSAVIEAGTPSPGAGLRSIAYFEIEGMPRFDRALEGCTVALGAGRKGELRCPALGNAAGARLSLVLGWDLN